MKSVFQDEKVCFITGATERLEEHHIIYGRGRRKKSEKYGYKIWLITELHRGTKNGVHFNKNFDIELKMMAQKHFENHHGSRNDFIKEFGMSYFEKKVNKL